MDFGQKLVSELTQLDGRQEAAELKSRTGRVNIYRLGLYLRAAEECSGLVASGLTPEAAFVDCFTPSREMHGVARKLGLRLDVYQGRWVRT